MNSIIIIAHGSKKETSNNEVLEIVNQIKNSKTNYALIQAAFLEFASPSIEDSVKNSIDKNILNIFIYPYFLNSGKHVSIDLPDIIKELEEENPTIEFELLEHFGKSNRISDIILDDISSSL